MVVTYIIAKALKVSTEISMFAAALAGAAMLVLPFNERYKPEHAEYLVEKLGRAADEARSDT